MQKGKTDPNPCLVLFATMGDSIHGVIRYGTILHSNAKWSFMFHFKIHKEQTA